MLAWWGGSINERGTLRSSVFKELQFKTKLEIHEPVKSTLAVLEISHVTRRMAGDSPVCCPTTGINTLSPLLAVFLVWMINYMVSLVLSCHLPLALAR